MSAQRCGDWSTRAVAGVGGVLVIEGPSGIGKSVLLEEVAGRARAAGVAVRSVHATRLGAELPFALARWLLEPAVRATPAVLEAGWARHARSLFEGDVGGVVDQRSLIEGLVTLVAELRQAGGPLALIVDDAQWGDPASLEFLGELAARSEDLGVALAVAVDTGHAEVDKPLLARLAAAPGSRTLALAPLSPSAVRALVRDRLPDTGDGFAARVAQAAGGNPLLVAELIASAERDGPDVLRIPEAVSRTVLLRLEDTDPAARALAEAVAVLGEAPLRLAAALAGLDARVADRAADELVARQVLVAGETVRFAQPLVGEALAATLAPFELCRAPPPSRGAVGRRSGRPRSDRRTSAARPAGRRAMGVRRTAPGGPHRPRPRRPGRGGTATGARARRAADGRRARRAAARAGERARRRRPASSDRGLRTGAR